MAVTILLQKGKYLTNPTTFVTEKIMHRISVLASGKAFPLSTRLL